MIQDHAAVLLHRVEGPVNLGSICRVMANFGFEKLLFSGALTHDNLLAQRFAVHADRLLESAEHRPDLTSLIAGFHTVYGFTPRNPYDDGRGLDIDGFLGQVGQDLAAGRQIGLLFGNEANGLDNNELSHCHYRVRLPSSENYESMNLAMAVGVVLWELRRRLNPSVSAKPMSNPEMASPGEIAQLIESLRSFTATFELLNPQNLKAVWRELNTLFKTRRWRKREVQLLHVLFNKSQSRYRSLHRRDDPDERAKEESG